MTTTPRKFVGHIVQDRPVTTKDGKDAGIIKKDPEPEKKLTIDDILEIRESMKEAEANIPDSILFGKSPEKKPEKTEGDENT